MKKNRIKWMLLLVLVWVPLTALAGDVGTYSKIMKAFKKLDNGCWFCSIFETLFNAINTVASNLSETLTVYAERLLYLGFLFYILFKVLKAVLSFSEISGKEFFTDMLMPILKCGVAIVVLENLDVFYETIVDPLATLGISFAQIFTDSNTQETMGLKEIVQISTTGGVALIEEGCGAISIPTIELEHGIGLGQPVNQAIQCFLRTISVSLIHYMAVGATFITDSWGLGIGGILPLFSMLGVGLCLFVGAFGIFLAFPFKLIDAMFRLMFVTALMPLWVIFWVLPATREYSQKAGKMFLNVIVTFICLSVVLLMVVTILSAAFSGLEGSPDEFTKMLLMGNTKKALAKVDWSTGAFFTMLAMTFLAWALAQSSDKFASEFGGGGSLGIADALQSKAMAGVGIVGTKAVKPALETSVKAVKNTPYAVGFIGGRIASKKPLRLTDIPGVKSIKEGYETGKSELKKGYESGRNTS